MCSCHGKVSEYYGPGENCKKYQPRLSSLFSSITSRHCGMVHRFGSTLLAVHNKTFTKVSEILTVF